MSIEVDEPDDAIDAAPGEEIETDPRILLEAERIAEALVFASAEPVSTSFIAERLPRQIDAGAIMVRLQALYAARGVTLVRIGDHWAFRTAPDLSFVIRTEGTEVRKLSRAALEVLAIIAYHQPVTRAEIEDIRGVQTSKGTLDVLLEAGWVRFRGRRRTPGRPVTFGTTRDFPRSLRPGRDPRSAGAWKSSRLQACCPAASPRCIDRSPIPRGNDDLSADEDPITQLDLEELGLLTPSG